MFDPSNHLTSTPIKVSVDVAPMSLWRLTLSRNPKRQQAEQFAARVLWNMLLRRPYRRAWEDLALRNGLTIEPGKVNQEAVRRVVAIYLHDEGHPDFKQDPETPEQLKRRPWRDRINRVATAEHLSADTLGAFLGAFEIEGKDKDRLLAVHAGDDKSVVVGELPPPEHSGFSKARHDTLVILDEHYLGVDGLPQSHETTQVVTPRVSGLTYFPVRFDIITLADFASFELLRGGAMREEPVKLSNDVFEYRIEFPELLALYETEQIKYRIKFAYQSPPPREYRRAVYGHLERLSIYVKFHSGRTPSATWWTEWQSWEPGSDILRDEPVQLDAELSVHRDLAYVENAVAGFRWEW